MPLSLSIRAYEPGDLDDVIAIFIGAIREVASRDYTSDQIDAWAQADRDGWSRRRLSRPTWVAVRRDALVGFTDLEPSGHLDMMFVHPRHQSTGVATALLARVEAAAHDQGLLRVFTEASLTARPFFEARGFSVEAEQRVQTRGQTFKNFKMAKTLERP